MTGFEEMVQYAWKGSALLGAGFLASGMLRRRSAALRHTAWTACFAALLALPPAMLLLPRWGILGSPETRMLQATPASATVSVSASAAPSLPAPIDVPLLLWIAGAGMVAIWFLAGILRTTWLVRHGSAAPGSSELAAWVGISRRVRILTSEAAPIPMTWGVLRPVIVLPVDSEKWPQARLRTVLLHELMHVKRLDVLAQIVGQAACCLYWFHPLAWLAARQLRKEREQACDDAVLACGVPAPEYAGHLMEMVRAAAGRRRAWTQAPAMAEASGLESRVRALLDAKRDRRPLNRRKALAIATAGAALLLPLAALSETTRVTFVTVPPPSGPPTPVMEIAPAPAVALLPVHHRKIVAIASAVEAAQEPAHVGLGSLTGIVRDPSGAVIPGCTVVLRALEGLNQETTTTDSGGQYRLNAIPAGRYSLEIQASGFAQFGVHQLEVTAGNATQINANLEIGSVNSVVTVTGKKPATVVPSVAAPQRIKVGGNVQPARLLSQVRPVYPAELQQLGVEGTVVLRAIISKEGIPLSLRAVSSSVDPRLVPLALDAVAQWRYQPVLLNGEPVEVPTTISVDFKLNQ